MTDINEAVKEIADAILLEGFKLGWNSAMDYVQEIGDEEVGAYL